MEHVDIDGVRLEVQRYSGSAVLAPIVFLHEGLGSVAMWRDFPAQVCAATGRAGLVVSRRGYGQSAPAARPLPPDYMQREAWQVLPALLAACGITQPVLLGHSDGATIALLYASRHPATACIAMAPHLLVEDLSLRSIAAARVAFETTDLRSKLARFHADVDGAFWQWNDVWLSQGFRSFNIEADCQQISCPLLAIQGHDDAYGSMLQIDLLGTEFTYENGLQPNKIMHRQLLKLEQCGHSPHKDQGPAVLAAVAQFVRPLR
jgi:pimeloyl-ACP methyl ester carboxylesterase